MYKCLKKFKCLWNSKEANRHPVQYSTCFPRKQGSLNNLCNLCSKVYTIKMVLYNSEACSVPSFLSSFFLLFFFFFNYNLWKLSTISAKGSCQAYFGCFPVSPQFFILFACVKSSYQVFKIPLLIINKNKLTIIFFFSPWFISIGSYMISRSAHFQGQPSLQGHGCMEKPYKIWIDFFSPSQ